MNFNNHYFVVAIFSDVATFVIHDSAATHFSCADCHSKVLIRGILLLLLCDFVHDFISRRDFIATFLLFCCSAPRFYRFDCLISA